MGVGCGFTRGLIWSPDGERVAYPTWDAVFVGPADGGEPRKPMEVPDGPWSLAWSPDGESVRVTDDTHQNGSPVWTPDGRSLLFVSDHGGGRDVYRVGVDEAGRPTGEAERVTTGLDIFTLDSSADGRTLCYSVARLRQNVWSLPVPREGSVSVAEAHPVTTGNRIVEAVGVSPDGKWLVFDLNRVGNVSLFKLPVGGTEPVQVTTGPMDFYPSWSPDASGIAFHAMRSDNRDIFVVSADGGTVRQLTNDPAQEFCPHWSPDGTRVAFHSGRAGGVDQIYVVSKEKGEPLGETAVQVTFDGEARGPRWSPDGRLIAYWLDGIFVVPSEGGPSRRLTDFGNRPMWLKDSRTLYFRESPPGDRVGIWSVPVSGGEATRLVRFADTARQPYFPEWSTDGETFYFPLTEFEADVWVMELEDSRD